jgi:hypothetical protein
VNQKRVGRPDLIQTNHNHWLLNEHGPALNVFWSRQRAGWAQQKKQGMKDIPTAR